MHAAILCTCQLAAGVTRAVMLAAAGAVLPYPASFSGSSASGRTLATSNLSSVNLSWFWVLQGVKSAPSIGEAVENVSSLQLTSHYSSSSVCFQAHIFSRFSQVAADVPPLA
jgi:hypothetical protein